MRGAALRAHRGVLPFVNPDDLKNPALYINRELSWLEFNERVLDQARDGSNPLLERVKFLAIVGTNLDQFFMIRVAAMLKKVRTGSADVAPDGLNSEQQLNAIWRRARRMWADQAACWDTLRRALQEEAIEVLDPGAWTPGIAKFVDGYFARDIYPLLTPLAVDPGHPFPVVSNLTKNFAVILGDGGRTRFAHVELPNSLPRFIELPEPAGKRRRQRFVFLEDVIHRNLPRLFPAVDIQEAHLFRVVRDADLMIDDDDGDDVLETVDRTLKALRRGPVALLQVEAGMPAATLNNLAEHFNIAGDIVLRPPGRLQFGDWMQLTAIQRPDLKDPPFDARVLWTPGENPEGIFGELRARDVLVHHPFDAFTTVEAFLRAAVRDPRVVAIKMTLYRTGPHSPVVDLLVEAAESGKQVAVLIELKARFDERVNILWARRLEAAGVHVVYGPVRLKTHCKLCLVVRQEPGGLRQYVHTATGNYNPETAKVYTDLGLFTADPEIAADVAQVFNYLTGCSNPKEFGALLVSPIQLRTRLCELIQREADHARAGRPARIIAKVNAITDDQMIRELYKAAQAGVSIDLLARGICALRPGVPGVSDAIRVHSIVGRFLEHSRIYWFENGGDDEMYVGSADLMERNLDRRVETLCPIRDARLRRHLKDVVLDAYVKDNDRAAELNAAGGYERVKAAAGRFNAQCFLIDHYTGSDTP